MHDLVIRNASICDGTGTRPVPGGVGIRDGRIVEVGPTIGAGRNAIDAGGLVLAPGIIDSHTHYDAQITWDPSASPSPALGVTTVVIGNCGFTIAPCRPQDRDLTMRNLTHVEGMSLAALRAGIDWQFESFPEYLDMIDGRPIIPNVAAYAGHSSIRTWVMGQAAVERAATEGEVAEMANLVRQAMAAGAIGFATSTADQHNGENGIPMPSRLADDSEIRALVAAMGESGRGVFMLTKGNRTSEAFIESLVADSGRPAMIAALLQNPTNPEAGFAELRNIAAARTRGRELYGQVTCCPLSTEFTMAAPYPFEGLKVWRPVITAPDAATVKRIYADPSFRQALRDELAVPAAVRLFNGEYDKFLVTEVADPANRAKDGQSVAALAAADGKDPLDWLLDFAVAEDLGTLFTALLLNSDDAALGQLLRDPNSLITLSDAGAHLTLFCDAGFGLHLLSHWSRELGQFTLGQAVHQLTGRPAAILRIPERGRIAPGYWADLMLFDPDTVGRGPKRRLHDLPGGATRLVTPATGLHGVWVNGVQVADANGIAADAAGSGRLLRKFDA